MEMLLTANAADGAAREEQLFLQRIAAISKRLVVEHQKKRHDLRKSQQKIEAVAVLGTKNRTEPILADIVTDGHLLEQMRESANPLPVLTYFMVAYVPPDLAQLDLRLQTSRYEAWADVVDVVRRTSWKFQVKAFPSLTRARMWLAGTLRERLDGVAAERT